MKMHLRAGTISVAEEGGEWGRAGGQRGGAVSASDGVVGGWCGAGPAAAESDEEGPGCRGGGGGEEGRAPPDAAAVAQGARVGGCGRAATTVEEEGESF